MAIIPVDRAVHTLMSWMKLEEPTFNSIIDMFYQGKQITFFEGLRKTIPESSLPSLEVGPTSDTGDWPFCRVQGDTISLEVHITISNKLIYEAMLLESRLASFADRILRYPPHLRGNILGTRIWFQDSYSKGVTYGAAGYNFNMRVCKINWEAKVLEYLADDMFPVILQDGTATWPT
jgi:hypothetical protein